MKHWYGGKVEPIPCTTAIAAGHQRLEADVAELDPADFAPCRGLIASPPCQSRSVAGKQLGTLDVECVAQAMLDLAEGRDTRAEHREACADARSMLTVEPLRWALALRPEWIALEQVPAVLPDWKLVGSLLERFGYSWWAGVLECERYGVPQTRERAILVASRVKVAHPPRATHQRYVYGQPAQIGHTLEGDVLPWVSMAEALGWGLTERPSVTVPADMHSGWVEAGSGSRATVRREVDRGAWVVRARGNTQGGNRPNGLTRSMTEPAHTVTSRADQWVFERPATTIACDPRVFQPGGHHQPGEQSTNAIVVTPAEAAVLQGFPPDYPWQGTTQEAVFRQIGNAVPPPLAAAVLGELIDSQEMRDAA